MKQKSIGESQRSEGSQSHLGSREGLGKRAKVAPPFVRRLRACLDSMNKNHVILWTSDGQKFALKNLPDLEDKVLPDMFKIKRLDHFYKKVPPS